jgi:hypothetical protein
MIYKEGDLIIGVDYCGKTHKSFKMRPQIVGDTIDLPEDVAKLKEEILSVDTKVGIPPGFLLKLNTYQEQLSLHILSGVLVNIGDIPEKEITVELVKTMTEIDSALLARTKEEWEVSLDPFRKQEKDEQQQQKDDSGSP